MTVHEWTLWLLRIGSWIVASAALGLILWGGWDLVLIARGKLHGNSISQAAMYQLYGWHPGVLLVVALVIGLVVGVLLGHFGWAQTRAP